MSWAACESLLLRACLGRVGPGFTGIDTIPIANLFRQIPDGRPTLAYDSYLVDSASSHMLVSKIKPCMSKYKQLYGETANGSLNQLLFI
jgi:hypothetical protein